MTTSAPEFRADIARSVRLLRAFRTEQADADSYYTLLADDTVRQLTQYTALDGRIVCDVGGGPGYFVRAFRAAGAKALCVDADAGELAGQGLGWSGRTLSVGSGEGEESLGPGGSGPRGPERGSVLGSALALPLATGSVDVCFASNVLEHVPEPRRMLDEMVRVTRSGGIVFCAFTNWLSPWGGHETSPWHYLGGDRAARRYEQRHGRAPKNRYGQGLFRVSVADALGWARGNAAAEVLDAVPRYLPGWTRPLVRMPAVREVLTWNLLLVLRRK